MGGNGDLPPLWIRFSALVVFGIMGKSRFGNPTRIEEKRGDGVSATGLVAQAWKEARKRPGSLVLAFWYLFIIVVFEYFSLSHLGPGFFHWLTRLTRTGTVPPLSRILAVKLGLVYLTFVLIVLPFCVGGLYGGVSAAVREQDSLTGLFMFFRQAVKNFWVSLGYVVTVVLSTAVLYLAFALILTVSAGNPVLAIALRLLALAVAIAWLAAMLYCQGAVYLGEEPVLGGLWHSIRWVARDLWFALRLMALLIGILIVAAVCFRLVAVIPGIGPIISMLGGGALLALLATFAMVLYRERANAIVRPRG